MCVSADDRRRRRRKRPCLHAIFLPRQLPRIFSLPISVCRSVNSSSSGGGSRHLCSRRADVFTFNNVVEKEAAAITSLPLMTGGQRGRNREDIHKESTSSSLSRFQLSAIVNFLSFYIYTLWYLFIYLWWRGNQTLFLIYAINFSLYLSLSASTKLLTSSRPWPLKFSPSSTAYAFFSSIPSFSCMFSSINSHLFIHSPYLLSRSVFLYYLISPFRLPTHTQ